MLSETSAKPKLEMSLREEHHYILLETFYCSNRDGTGLHDHRSRPLWHREQCL